MPKKQRRPGEGAATSLARDGAASSIARADRQSARRRPPRKVRVPRCLCLQCTLRTLGRAWTNIERGRAHVAQDMLGQLSIEIVEKLEREQPALPPASCRPRPLSIRAAQR
jgi:hypothetical protein